LSSAPHRRRLFQVTAPRIKTHTQGIRMSQIPLTHGVHHIGLTVPDVAETADFFVSVLGFTQVGTRPDYPAVFVRDTAVLLSLWQVQETDRLVAFERKNTVGLHHLALNVEGEQGLASAFARLAGAPGVTIEFGPEPLGKGPSYHMMCQIPGGIRLELIAAAQKA
jgi:catechol 2,3-dioxygenase-like lactoylglutathione lyase family enzyme